MGQNRMDWDLFPVKLTAVILTVRNKCSCKYPTTPSVAVVRWWHYCSENAENKTCYGFLSQSVNKTSFSPQIMTYLYGHFVSRETILLPLNKVGNTDRLTTFLPYKHHALSEYSK